MIFSKGWEGVVMASVAKTISRKSFPEKDKMVWIIWTFVGERYGQIFEGLTISVSKHRVICNVDQVRILACWRLKKLHRLISSDQAVTNTGEFTEEVRGLLSPLINRCRRAALK